MTVRETTFSLLCAIAPEDPKSLHEMQADIVAGDALNVVTELQAEQSSDVGRMHYLSYVQYGIGDYVGCQETVDAILRLTPGDPEAQLRKADAQWASGAYELARQTLLQTRDDLTDASPMATTIDAKIESLNGLCDQVDRLRSPRTRLQVMFLVSVIGLTTFAVGGIFALARSARIKG